MSDQLDEYSNENGCPICSSPLVSPVKYTWWGGLIGPKLFHHTKCEACGYRFNSKTRKSNTTAIVIYSVVIFVIAFALMFYIKTA
ncbi:MAG: hypothetical protein WCJ85_02480 [Chitinophagaceae bacterium]